MVCHSWRHLSCYYPPGQQGLSQLKTSLLLLSSRPSWSVTVEDISTATILHAIMVFHSWRHLSCYYPPGQQGLSQLKTSLLLLSCRPAWSFTVEDISPATILQASMVCHSWRHLSCYYPPGHHGLSQLKTYLLLQSSRPAWSFTVEDVSTATILQASMVCHSWRHLSCYYPPGQHGLSQLKTSLLLLSSRPSWSVTVEDISTATILQAIMVCHSWRHIYCYYPPGQHGLSQLKTSLLLQSSRPAWSFTVEDISPATILQASMVCHSWRRLYCYNPPGQHGLSQLKTSLLLLSSRPAWSFTVEDVSTATILQASMVCHSWRHLSCYNPPGQHGLSQLKTSLLLLSSRPARSVTVEDVSPATILQASMVFHSWRHLYCYNPPGQHGLSQLKTSLLLLSSRPAWSVTVEDVSTATILQASMVFHSWRHLSCYYPPGQHGLSQLKTSLLLQSSRPAWSVTVEDISPATILQASMVFHSWRHLSCYYPPGQHGLSQLKTSLLPQSSRPAWSFTVEDISPATILQASMVCHSWRRLYCYNPPGQHGLSQLKTSLLLLSSRPARSVTVEDISPATILQAIMVCHSWRHLYCYYPPGHHGLSQLKTSLLLLSSRPSWSGTVEDISPATILQASMACHSWSHLSCYNPPGQHGLSQLKTSLLLLSSRPARSVTVEDISPATILQASMVCHSWRRLYCYNPPGHHGLSQLKTSLLLLSSRPAWPVTVEVISPATILQASMVCHSWRRLSCYYPPGQQGLSQLKTSLLLLSCRPEWSVTVEDVSTATILQAIMVCHSWRHLSCYNPPGHHGLSQLKTSLLPLSSGPSWSVTVEDISPATILQASIVCHSWRHLSCYNSPGHHGLSQLKTSLLLLSSRPSWSVTVEDISPATILQASMVCHSWIHLSCYYPPGHHGLSQLKTSLLLLSSRPSWFVTVEDISPATILQASMVCHSWRHLSCYNPPGHHGLSQLKTSLLLLSSRPARSVTVEDVSPATILQASMVFHSWRHLSCYNPPGQHGLSQLKTSLLLLSSRPSWSVTVEDISTATILQATMVFHSWRRLYCYNPPGQHGLSQLKTSLLLLSSRPAWSVTVEDISPATILQAIMVCHSWRHIYCYYPPGHHGLSQLKTYLLLLSSRPAWSVTVEDISTATILQASMVFHSWRHLSCYYPPGQHGLSQLKTSLLLQSSRPAWSFTVEDVSTATILQASMVFHSWRHLSCYYPPGQHGLSQLKTSLLLQSSRPAWSVTVEDISPATILQASMVFHSWRHLSCYYPPGRHGLSQLKTSLLPQSSRPAWSFTVEDISPATILQASMVCHSWRRLYCYNPPGQHGLSQLKTSLLLLSSRPARSVTVEDISPATILQAIMVCHSWRHLYCYYPPGQHGLSQVKTSLLLLSSRPAWSVTVEDISHATILQASMVCHSWRHLSCYYPPGQHGLSQLKTSLLLLSSRPAWSVTVEDISPATILQASMVWHSWRHLSCYNPPGQHGLSQLKTSLLLESSRPAWSVTVEDISPATILQASMVSHSWRHLSWYNPPGHHGLSQLKTSLLLLSSRPAWSVTVEDISTATILQASMVCHSWRRLSCYYPPGHHDLSQLKTSLLLLSSRPAWSVTVEDISPATILQAIMVCHSWRHLYCYYPPGQHGLSQLKTSLLLQSSRPAWSVTVEDISTATILQASKVWHSWRHLYCYYPPGQQGLTQLKTSLLLLSSRQHGLSQLKTSLLLQSSRPAWSGTVEDISPATILQAIKVCHSWRHLSSYNPPGQHGLAQLKTSFLLLSSRPSWSVTVEYISTATILQASMVCHSWRHLSCYYPPGHHGMSQLKTSLLLQSSRPAWSVTVEDISTATILQAIMVCHSWRHLSCYYPPVTMTCYTMSIVYHHNCLLLVLPSGATGNIHGSFRCWHSPFLQRLDSV